MLAYFPQVYPGELLYSVLARYHQHTGAPSPIQSMEALFGRRLVVASIDLPSYVQALADRLPSGLNQTANGIIDKFTLLPYYTAFQPFDVSESARSAMREGHTDGLLMRLGLATFCVARVTQLQFCGQCMHAMKTKYGECYWRRDHQLPGVLVCPEHGCSLQRSSVSVTVEGRHTCIPATPKNCPWRGSALVSGLDDATMAALQRLAKGSSQLLEHRDGYRSLTGLAQHYRHGVQAAGFARTVQHVDQRKLYKAFFHHHRQVLILFPSLLDKGGSPGTWLARMVRKHRQAFHPLQHLLLQDFLDHQALSPGPFGEKPWPCLNPLARHRNRLVVTERKSHRNHGHLVSVFTCRCGYTYTRSWFADGKRLGAPKFQAYGPMLAPALRKMTESGMSLRAIALRVGLYPRTVVKLAIELGLSVPWTPRTSKRKALPIATTPHPARPRKPRAQAPRVIPKPRLDWEAIDHQVSQKIRTTVDQLKLQEPPARITALLIERLMWNRGWITKRARKLPKSAMLLREVIEPIEQFQQRRAAWIIQQMDWADEPLQVWRILRRAGLTSKHTEMVDTLLSKYLEAPIRAAL